MQQSTNKQKSGKAGKEKRKVKGKQSQHEKKRILLRFMELGSEFQCNSYRLPNTDVAITCM